MMNYVRKLNLTYALFIIYISYNMYIILDFLIFIKCLYNDETNKKNSIPLRRVVDQNVHRRIGIERSPRLVQEVGTDRQVWWVHDDR